MCDSTKSVLDDYNFMDVLFLLLEVKVSYLVTIAHPTSPSSRVYRTGLPFRTDHYGAESRSPTVHDDYSSMRWVFLYLTPKVDESLASIRDCRRDRLLGQSRGSGLMVDEAEGIAFCDNRWIPTRHDSYQNTLVSGCNFCNVIYST